MNGETSIDNEMPEVDAAPVRLPKVDLLDWILFIPFVLAFLSVLCVFDVIERVAFVRGGRREIKRWVIPRLSQWLRYTLRIVGARVNLATAPRFEPGRACVVVSNHQSMFDIPFIGEVFAEREPCYVAKIELGKFIPGISFSLRNSGDILIDRANSGQALREIVKLGKRINAESTAAVIFPEGTRARDGILKSFKPAGLTALLRVVDRPLIYPVTFDGSWLISAHARGPIPRGMVVRMKIGEPIDPARFDNFGEAIAETYRVIAENLEFLRRESQGDAITFR
jgi:1-acyl-sn-glycerol-3-phosphate acyltransferase